MSEKGAALRSVHSHEAVHDCGLGLSIAKGLAFDEVASRGGQENLVARDFSVVAEWSNPADLDVGSDDLKCRSGRLVRSLRGG